MKFNLALKVLQFHVGMENSVLPGKAGPAVSDKGGIYHGINRYKLSRHKQVSDTQHVWNCHKQVLTNETV